MTSRLLFKHAPWNDIHTRVSQELERMLTMVEDLDTCTNRFALVVRSAVEQLTPRTNPSP
jgi:hypothetical protein